MRANRLRPVSKAFLLVSIALAITSCGDDTDETAPGSAQPETESTAELTAEPTTSDETTSAPESATAEQTSTGHICPHVPNVVLVENPNGEPLNLRGNLEAREPGELTDLLGYEDFPDEFDVDAALGELLEGNQITAYEVTDGSDSLDNALQIELENPDVAGLVAAPLLLLTLTGHWTLAPADLPTAASQDGNEPPQPFDSQATVAVVDTGYTDGDEEFQWLDDRVDGVDSAFDAERVNITPNVAGHGKFVASVITQEAPNVAVRVARLAEIEPAVAPPNEPTVFTTDELQLYIAIRRLLQLDIGYSALNLSLGSYACEGLGDPVDNSGLAIRKAVELWSSALPEAPIFAAAGNHDPSDSAPLPPFLPAAYDSGPNDSINAVMSIDMAGNTSVFSNGADLGALGERLIGVGLSSGSVDADDDGWIYWSGSSFATALLTARAVRDGGVSAGTLLTAPDYVLAETPTSTSTTPSNTAGSSTPGTAATTTRPPTSPTTTTLG